MRDLAALYTHRSMHTSDNTPRKVDNKRNLAVATGLSAVRGARLNFFGVLFLTAKRNRKLEKLASLEIVKEFL